MLAVELEARVQLQLNLGQKDHESISRRPFKPELARGYSQFDQRRSMDLESS